MKYVIAYDVGTTGLKTCLFKLDEKIELVADASAGYPLYTLPDGGSEQEPNDWWEGMKKTTKVVLANSKIKPEQIDGISFCSQMQAVILVDKDGVPVRRSMGYMDQRATEEVKKGISYGLQVAGANIFKLIPSLVITGAVTTTPKDPVWKYKWIEAHEPENFARAYKWLDVKDFLILKCTNRFTMTEDSAFATLIYDNRPNKGVWSQKMCKMFNINMDHLPQIIKSTDVAGLLTEKAAEELGLVPDIKVFGGGGDSSLIGVGSGCVVPGDTHIYCGTSGWVNTIVEKRRVDTTNMIAAITGAQPGLYNYFAEMETAGKCFEWVKDHLALDEIDIYLHKKNVEEVSNYEGERKTLYSHLNHVIKDVPPGSNGVIFTPWLHGNRCPFEDPNAMGMFFGIKIETKKVELIRSVLEGIYFHLRWMLECQDDKIKTSSTIRFVGGGALSPIACQILADILNRRVETIADPQNVGAIGAAAICGVGLGEIKEFRQIASFIPVVKTYDPNNINHEAYEPYYQTFKNLYKTNKKNFDELKHKSAKDKTQVRKERIRALKFILVSASAGIIQLLSTLIFELAFCGITGNPYGEATKQIWEGSTAYIIGLVLSVIWNFTLNRKFTFKSANNVPKAMGLAFLFYLFFAPATLFLQGALGNGYVFNWHFMPKGLGIPAIVGTIICMILNFILEYLWQRFVVFRGSIDSNKK